MFLYKPRKTLGFSWFSCGNFGMKSQSIDFKSFAGTTDSHWSRIYICRYNGIFYFQNLHTSAFYTFVGGSTAFGLYLDGLCLIYLGVVMALFIVVDFSKLLKMTKYFDVTDWLLNIQRTAWAVNRIKLLILGFCYQNVKNGTLTY